MAALALLGACSADGSVEIVESTPGPVDSANETSGDTDADPDADTAIEEDDDTSDTSTDVDTPDDSDSAPVAPDIGPADAVQFVDPDGRYTMSVSPDWETAHEVLAIGIELFYVNASGANINMITQAVGPIDTEEYLRLNVDTMGEQIEGAIVVDHTLLFGESGQELGQIEFTADGSHFIQIYAVEFGEVTIATLTASPEQYALVSEDALPYLLTLTPTL